MAEPTSVDQLAAVISHATAPSFMLGAVAGFLSILISRAERVADLWHAATEERGSTTGDPFFVTADLEQRLGLLHGAIFLAVLSGLATAALLIITFVSALVHIRHEPGAAILFSVALALLMASLVQLTRDIRLAMRSLPTASRKAITGVARRQHE